jgi:hypothetical protein
MKCARTVKKVLLVSVTDDLVIEEKKSLQLFKIGSLIWLYFHLITSINLFRREFCELLSPSSGIYFPIKVFFLSFLSCSWFSARCDSHESIWEQTQNKIITGPNKKKMCGSKKAWMNSKIAKITICCSWRFGDDRWPLRILH